MTSVSILLLGLLILAAVLVLCDVVRVVCSEVFLSFDLLFWSVLIALYVRVVVERSCVTQLARIWITLPRLRG